MEKVSVIVPIYGVEAYLDRCVRSIVDQTYENLEIILVDDGSPDRCPAICDAWATRDSRIKVIHKENGGLSDARNTGLKIATGKYIAFVDSDDWISADYIYLMYQAIKKTDAEIAACDVAVSYGEEVFFPIVAEPAIMSCTAEAALDDLLQGHGFRAVAWNKLYKISLLENERYPVGKYHEDEFFTYRILAKAKKLVYVDRIMYAYFQRPDSIMHSVSMKHLDALEAHLERLLFLHKKFPCLYAKDKVAFCTACVGIYRKAGKRCNTESQAMKRKIKEYRKNVHFSLLELRQMRGRHLGLVLGSRICPAVLSGWLNMRERRNDNG